MFFTLKQDLQKWCVYTHIYMYIHLPQQLKLRVTSRSVTIPWAESDQPKLDSKINIKQMSRCSGLSSVLFSSVTTLWCEQSDYIWPRFRCQQLPLFDNRSHTLWPFTHRSQVLGFHMWYHGGLMFWSTALLLYCHILITVRGRRFVSYVKYSLPGYIYKPCTECFTKK